MNDDCILQSVRGDQDVKPAPNKKVCGGAKVKDRKTSRSWNAYDAEDRSGQE